MGRDDDAAAAARPLKPKRNTVASLDVAWAVKAFGSLSKATRQAEAAAVAILEREHDASKSWAEDYIEQIRAVQHAGDCPVCRSWLRGPITCNACVYDDLMLEAWRSIQLEDAPPDGPAP